MDIEIKINENNMMYHTYINGDLYDARDGFVNVEDMISDAATTFLYDQKVDYSKGFKVTFE